MRFTTGLLLAALISPWAHAELIDDVNDRNELRIAVEANTPPFNFKEDGKLTGFEIELGQALARELGVNVSFVEVTDDDLLQGVESGKYDIALNQIALSPELGERLDVSKPYSNRQPVKDAVIEPPQIPYAASQSLVPTQSSAQKLVIPFQKDNPAFQSALDNALQRLKDSGRLAELSEKWLGKDPSTASKP